MSRVCLSVGTTAHPPRSLNSGPNFRTLNLKIIKTCPVPFQVLESHVPIPGPQISDQVPKSGPILNFLFPLLLFFCFDESNLTHYPPMPASFQVSKFRSQFHILISSPYLNLKSPNSGPHFSIFFLFSLFVIYTIVEFFPKFFFKKIEFTKKHLMKIIFFFFGLEKAKENLYSFEMKCTHYLYNLKAFSPFSSHFVCINIPNLFFFPRSQKCTSPNISHLTLPYFFF